MIDFYGRGENRPRVVQIGALAILLTVCAAMLAPQSAWAQTATSGSITGTVTDPSGAIVPGASVELTSRDTNAVQTKVTNEAGQYSFTGVRPGLYSMTVSLTGFSTASFPNVTV